MESTVRNFRARIAGQSLAVLTVLGLVAACSGGDDESNQSGDGGLSMTKVAMLASSAGDGNLMYVAQAEGYFKDEGLEVDLESSGASANAPSSARLAAFFNGSFQFINQAAGSSILAHQNGGPIKAVFTTSVGASQVMNIDGATAKALGISELNDTPETATAAFLALKGSHITVGVGSTTSLNYFDLLAACKVHGLDCGVDKEDADITMKVIGTNESATAGMKAGKFKALLNGGVNSHIDGTAVIEMGQVTPIATAVNFNLSTSPKMIQEHPDTVQAVVNALVRAWDYTKKNVAGAEKHFVEMLNESGVTDTATLHEVFEQYRPYWKTPLLLKDAFEQQTKILELSGQGTIKVTYDDFNDPSFVEKAVKQFNVDAPTVVG